MAAAALHLTVLTYWRHPLAASARPNRSCDVVREVVAATGALVISPETSVRHAETGLAGGGRPKSSGLP